MDIIVRELLDGYEQARDGRLTVAAAARNHYKDFAAWQHRALAADASGHRAYWLNTLAGDLPIIDLPADRPRPSVQSFRGSVLTFTIDAAPGEAMRLLAQQHGATAFMAWLTVVRLLLFRYTRATDAIVATPVAGREHVDLADQVGFYVNMLPLGSRCHQTSRPAACWNRSRRSRPARSRTSCIPTIGWSRSSAIRRDAGRNPLFDVVVSVTEARAASALPGGLTATSVDLDEVTSKFDVTFFFIEKADGAWHLRHRVQQRPLLRSPHSAHGGTRRRAGCERCPASQCPAGGSRTPPF